MQFRIVEEEDSIYELDEECVNRKQDGKEENSSGYGKRNVADTKHLSQD